MKRAEFDETNNIILVEFSGLPSLAKFKEIAMSEIDLLKEKKTTKILNDISKLEAVSIENQEWVQTVWFPEAEKAGLRYFAFLMAVDIFGQVSAEQTNEKAEDEGIIQIKYFDNKDEAVQWLVSVE